MGRYGKYGRGKSRGSSSSSSSKPKRTLSPEQLEKMKQGREEAKQKREAEQHAEEVHRSRLEAVAELDKKLRNAEKEDREYERMAKQALKYRRRNHH